MSEWNDSPQYDDPDAVMRRAAEMVNALTRDVSALRDARVACRVCGGVNWTGQIGTGPECADCGTQYLRLLPG